MAAKAQSVLVVEDETSIASFVALYLKNAGYRVQSAGTGQEALDGIGREQGGRESERERGSKQEQKPSHVPGVSTKAMCSQ